MLPGGNGIAFDWRTLAGVTPQLGTNWMLSGGLAPGNVAEAVRLTGAPAVDVSSGVEIRTWREVARTHPALPSRSKDR